MQSHQEAMLKSLVAVAWADGRLDGKESELLTALSDAFELEASDAEAIREYAKEPRKLDSIDLTELSASDRRLLLLHAVVVTYIDGEQSEEEKKLLSQLAEQLKVPEHEAKSLFSAGEERVKQNISLLRK